MRRSSVPPGAAWICFFVVSGFLISGLLFSEYRKTGGIRFRRFAIRRAVKIYPAFYAIVVVTVAGNFTRHPFSFRDGIWRRALHDVFFMQSYWQGTSGHFWSLSVEEHFYILLPLALFFFLNAEGRGSQRRPVLRPFQKMLSGGGGKAFAVGALLLNARAIVPFDWKQHPWIVPRDWQDYLTPTHLRLDSLFFGVVISHTWYHFHRERAFRRLPCGIVMACWPPPRSCSRRCFS